MIMKLTAMTRIGTIRMITIIISFITVVSCRHHNDCDNNEG